MKILIEESVLRQALEAMDLLRYWNKTEPADKAITTLRTALDAAEKVEPVCWMQSNHLTMFKQRHSGSSMAMVRCSDHKAMDDFQPLYTHPAPAVPEDEIEKLREQLATVTAERDELVATLKRLGAAYIRLKGCHPLPQNDGYEEMMKASELVAKLGADKTGEV